MAGKGAGEQYRDTGADAGAGAAATGAPFSPPVEFPPPPPDAELPPAPEQEPEPPALPQPTGNVPADLEALKESKATPLQVAEYMDEYGKSYDYTQPNEYLESVGITLPDKGAFYQIGERRVPATVWDTAKPHEQFNFMQRAGYIPTNAELVMDDDGNWNYRLPVTAKAIPADLYETYLANKEDYEARGKPPPLHYDESVPGQVTVISYKDPSRPITYAEPEGLSIVFKNVKGNPVVHKVIDEETGQDILATIDGEMTEKGVTYDQTMLAEALSSGRVRPEAVTLLLGAIAVQQAKQVVGLGGEVLPLPTRKGGYEVTEIEDYREGDGYRIDRYLRDNAGAPAVAETALLEMGFSQGEINRAKEYNALPWNRVTAQDKVARAFYDVGIDLTGADEPEDLERKIKLLPSGIADLRDTPVKGLKPEISLKGFTANFVAVRENLPEWQTIKNEEARKSVLSNMAVMEYRRLYGRGTLAASEGTDVLAFIAPAARALHPEVKFRDIGGAEWALTGANVVLLALAPIMGVVPGAVGKVATRALTVGATLTYPVVTVAQWGKMTPAERVINLTIDVALGVAVLGKPLIQSLKYMEPGIGFSSRVKGIATSVRSGSATKVWQSADRLEQYGRSLEKAGVEGGSRIVRQAEYLKANARAIARSRGVTGALPSELSAVLDDLKSLDAQMEKLRQKGGVQLRTAEQVREGAGVRRVTVEDTPVWFAREFDHWRAKGLSADELYELLRASGGDKALFQKLADLRLPSVRKLDELNKALDAWDKKRQAKERFARSAEEDFAELQRIAEQRRTTGAEGLAERERLLQKDFEAEYATELAAIRAERTIASYKRLFGKSARVKPLPFTPERAVDKTTGEEILTMVRITRTGKVGATWVLAIPALVAGVVEIIETGTNTKLSAREKSDIEQGVREAVATKVQQSTYPDVDTIIETAVKTHTQTKIDERTETVAKQATELATETATATKLQTKPETKTEVKTEAKTRTETGTRTGTETAVQRVTRLATALAPVFPPVSPVRPPAPPVPPQPPLPPRVRVRLGGGDEVERKPVPPGSIAWAQGAFWKYISPPYNQNKPVTLSQAPAGATRTDSNRPVDTIQIIGRAGTSVPRRVAVDLGWADIIVLRGRKIQFTGGGEQTNVGTRIDSPTMGMSVGDYPGGEPVSESSVAVLRRTGASKRVSPHKGKRLTDYERMTTLKGFRF